MSSTRKNLTTSEVTTHYYLGGKEVAQRKGTALSYIHQDHLTGTSVVSDSSGDPVSSTSYQPYGSARNSSGTMPTDRLFTGQRLDDTGLYYYGARYYDAGIGRFISADTIVPNPMNPQSLNRYSYVLNNPLKYTDPTGLFGKEELNSIGIYGGNVSGDIWRMLRDAGAGDKVVIDGQAYHFYHYVQDDRDENGILRLWNADTLLWENVADKMTDSGLKSIERYVWDQGKAKFEKQTVKQADPLKALAIFPLVYTTIEACVPAALGTAVTAALTVAYAPAIAAGPVGWIAVPVIAVTQVTTIVGGWGTSILLFQHEVIPSWKEYFNIH